MSFYWNIVWTLLCTVVLFSKFIITTLEVDGVALIDICHIELQNALVVRYYDTWLFSSLLQGTTTVLLSNWLLDCRSAKCCYYSSVLGCLRKHDNLFWPRAPLVWSPCGPWCYSSRKGYMLICRLSYNRTICVNVYR